MNTATNTYTYTANDILSRLRSFGACGDAVRPEPTEEGPTGWVVEYLEENPGRGLRDLWYTAVTEHLDHAWWLAEELDVARPAVDNACRRALTYVANLSERTGLDGTELRQVAGTETLDLASVETAVRAVADASYNLATDEEARLEDGHLCALFSASKDLARTIAEARRRGHRQVLPGAQEEASWVACNISPNTEVDEYNRQSVDLLALWPEIEGAFSAL